MPVSVSYPGVYIQEIDSGVRSIAGVPTSITAFVGRARRGPVDEPVLIHGLGEFTRRFGGLWAEAPLGHAVAQYYQNGGVDAVIVRAYDPPPTGDGASSVTLPASGASALTLRAANPGKWGDRLVVTVKHDDADSTVFHLTIEELAPGPLVPTRPAVVASERFVRLSHIAGSPRFVSDVLAAQSRLVRVTAPPSGRVDEATDEQLQGGSDGDALTVSSIADRTALEDAKRGLWALEKTDLFNLLVIPPLAPDVFPDKTTWDTAAAYAHDRRAILLVDPDPGWTEANSIDAAAVAAHAAPSENAALYFPRIDFADPLQENRPRPFPPAGAVAGVIARIDGERGLWKSPAGQEATVAGAGRLGVHLTDRENGVLNPRAVNCLRSFPATGAVVWGARTLRGADALADQWKYLSVRRTALYIEESLYRGTQWVVFEPNDEPLWSQIRLSVGAFMNGLFRQGAFQGTTPAQAYYVKCDRDSNPQEDIDRGIVNIFVGFAPLKPAEFVIVSIQQIRPAE
ncbi:phage tail sheath subtilisin-like domain-containing protein [Microbacterium oryzae]|uniref:Phage tail sheath family protein n=1 Tax=Microbacterium oryzae TaxID=743009 RepID=A0A6I6E5M3_9MICO|nr:phage tail sheath C-terminal domain-containing protein [Microbacterium oryzae]QGU27031.1 phage tail sheath family protein [Microbacterium oryzae]